MSSFYHFVRENLILATIELAAENRNSVLNLGNSYLNDLPQPLFQLKDLTKLYLNNNLLKTLPKEISKLQYLRVLTLDYNQLRSIPPDIGKLSDLVCLNLSYNNLGHLTPEIGQLTRLEVLWLNHTHLESLPPEIGNCTYLDTLGARGNFLKELPLEIGKLTRLRWLTLEGNLLSKVPEEISGLESLIHLNLSNNQFEKLPELFGIQTLQFVFLSQNFITDMDIEVLEKMIFIKKVDLADNPISNPWKYENISNLKLSNNNFHVSPDFQSDVSDSEDWEESVPSSDLDISDSSVEDLPLDEILESALPLLARFTSPGI